MTEDKNTQDHAADSAEVDTATAEQAEAAEKAEVCFDYREIEEMMAVIEEKNRLLQEHTDRIKRLQADFDNYRRRTRQEKEELSALVIQNMIRDLLPLLDNFERAMSADAGQDAEAFKSGLEMVYRQFTCILEKNGLEPLAAQGATFDPQFHEAVMRVDDDSQPEGTIVEELQKGYRVRGKIIRPSMVKVVGC